MFTAVVYCRFQSICLRHPVSQTKGTPILHPSSSPQFQWLFKTFATATQCLKSSQKINLEVSEMCKQLHITQYQMIMICISLDSAFNPHILSLFSICQYCTLSSPTKCQRVLSHIKSMKGLTKTTHLLQLKISHREKCQCKKNH